LLTDLKLAMKRCRTSADGRADAGQELASREGLNEQGEPRRLMVVESEGKMQDVFRQLFKKNGYRVLVASDPERALQRFYDDHDAADLMLFSSIAIGRSALAMFNRFGQEPLTREVPAVLLLGKEHDWADEADIAEHRITCRMPIKPRELREVLLNATTKQVS
jgi:serine/threonine-protein kinase